MFEGEIHIERRVVWLQLTERAFSVARRRSNCQVIAVAIHMDCYISRTRDRMLGTERWRPRRVSERGRSIPSIRRMRSDVAGFAA